MPQPLQIQGKFSQTLHSWGSVVHNRPEGLAVTTGLFSTIAVQRTTQTPLTDIDVSDTLTHKSQEKQKDMLQALSLVARRKQGSHLASLEQLALSVWQSPVLAYASANAGSRLSLSKYGAHFVGGRAAKGWAEIFLGPATNRSLN